MTSNCNSYGNETNTSRSTPKGHTNRWRLLHKSFDIRGPRNKYLTSDAIHTTYPRFFPLSICLFTPCHSYLHAATTTDWRRMTGKGIRRSFWVWEFLFVKFLGRAALPKSQFWNTETSLQLIVALRCRLGAQKYASTIFSYHADLIPWEKFAVFKSCNLPRHPHSDMVTVTCLN